MQYFAFDIYFVARKINSLISMTENLIDFYCSLLVRPKLTVLKTHLNHRCMEPKVSELVDVESYCISKCTRYECHIPRQMMSSPPWEPKKFLKIWIFVHFAHYWSTLKTELFCSTNGAPMTLMGEVIRGCRRCFVNIFAWDIFLLSPLREKERAWNKSG